MVTPTHARPGDEAAVDRAATRAVDDLTAFVLNTLDTRKPMVVRGVVTAITRDSTGINEVSIQRTGQHSADPSPYVVYAQGFVPIVNDRITLQKLGSSWLVVGADHGGRPNEHTIAYTGGSHRKYNAARVKQHEHFDTHHAVHYATDGATVAHHNHPSGHKAHTGDHIQNAQALDASGNATGLFHKKTHNTATARYEHYQSGTIVRHHAVTGDHGHYSDGQLIHNIVTVGAHAGQTKHKQHNTTAYHLSGDDGAGRLHGQHASGNRAWDHDGVAHRVYGGGRGNTNELVRFEGSGSSNGGLARFGQTNSTSLHGLGDDGTGKFYAAHANGNRVIDHDGTLWQQYAANVVAVTHDGQTHRVYSSVGGYAEVARHQSSGAGGGGQLALKLYNTTTAQTHLMGDDGAGKLHLKHGAGNKVLDHDGTTLQHYAGGVVAAQHVTSGAGAKHRIARSATTWHEIGEDGTGKFVATINGVKGWDHDGTTATTYGGGGLPATTHDGTTHTVYGVGSSARIPSSRSRFISGNSAVVDIMRDGTAFHSVGDDGTGLLYLKHGLAGARVLDHDGTTLRHYGGGVLAATHNGSDFSTYIGAARVASMQAVGSSARQFLSINTGNLSHWIGDDTTGNLSQFSNGQVYLYTNANNSGRKHTFNGDVYTLPQGQTMDSGIGGASEVRLLPQGSPSGYGKGAIKQSSHSTTILTPSVGASVSTNGGNITNGGGNGDANLAAGHFKFAGANLCYGTAPSTYRHGAAHPSANSGYGLIPEGAGGTGTGFVEVDTHSDGGMFLYGTSYSGAAWSGTAYFQTEVIN